VTRLLSARPAPPATAGATGGAGLAAVIGATVAFSWGFVIVKSVGLGAPAIAFWRLLIGAAVLALVTVARRDPWPRRLGPLLGAGVMFGLHQLVFIVATQTTTIAIVTLLGALQPLLVGLVSRRTVGERVPRRLLWCALLALAGVAVVVAASLDSEARSLGGDLLAALNAVVFTAYFLFAKRGMDAGARTLPFTTGVLAVSLVVVLPGLALGGPILPASGGELALLAVLALLPGNGHLLLNWAHPRVSAALSSLVLASVPLLASVWARLAFGEPYGWQHVLGMLLVVAAIEAGRRVQRDHGPAEPPLPEV